MLFALLAAVLAVVTTVVFITIGDSAPPFNMPQGAAAGDYGGNDRSSERARDRARRKKESQEFDRKQKENGHSHVSNMTPLPVGDCDHNHDHDDEEEEDLDEELEEEIVHERHRPGVEHVARRDLESVKPREPITSDPISHKNGNLSEVMNNKKSPKLR